MTTKEMIEKLEAFENDAVVVIADPYGGLINIGGIEALGSNVAIKMPEKNYSLEK